MKAPEGRIQRQLHAMVRDHGKFYSFAGCKVTLEQAFGTRPLTYIEARERLFALIASGKAKTYLRRRPRGEAMTLPRLSM